MVKYSTKVFQLIEPKYFVQIEQIKVILCHIFDFHSVARDMYFATTKGLRICCAQLKKKKKKEEC